MRLLRSSIAIRENEDATEGYVFDFVTDFQVTSSWDMLTDTARIVVPRRVRILKNGKVARYIVQGVDSVFKRGQYVTIDAGYFPTPEYVNIPIYNRVFEGFIAQLNPKRPLEFTLEDAMFKLQRMRIVNYKSENKISLPNALAELRLRTPTSWRH